MGVYYTNPDPTAVVGRRIGAGAIDLALIALVGVVMFLASADFYTVGAGGLNEAFCDTNLFDRFETDDGRLVVPDGDGVCLAVGDDQIWLVDDTGIAAIIFVSLGIQLANHVLLQGLTGATIGKLMVGLRVVDQRSGKRAGFGAVFVRWLLWIVDGFPWAWGPIAGTITMAATNGHRRVGDMAAKTFVVRTDAVGIMPIVPGVTAPPGYAAPSGVPAGPHPGVAPPGHPPTTVPNAPPTGATPPVGAAPPPPFSSPGPGVDPAWPAPDPAAAASTPASTGGADQPGVGAPLWDERRDTYIQWDPELSQWMQWDDSRSSWRPIS